MAGCEVRVKRDFVRSRALAGLRQMVARRYIRSGIRMTRIPSCRATAAARAFAVYFPRFPRSAIIADLLLAILLACSGVHCMRESGVPV
jgi:hypothetical protein